MQCKAIIFNELRLEKGEVICQRGNEAENCQNRDNTYMASIVSFWCVID